MREEKLVSGYLIDRSVGRSVGRQRVFVGKNSVALIGQCQVGIGLNHRKE